MTIAVCKPVNIIVKFTTWFVDSRAEHHREPDSSRWISEICLYKGTVYELYLLFLFLLFSAQSKGII